MELIKAEARKVCACVYNIALTISETIIIIRFCIIIILVANSYYMHVYIIMLHIIYRPE